MPPGLRFGVEIRAAQSPDAAELARLLAQAGAVTTEREAATRLEAMRARSDGAVLVATGYGGLSGMVALSWAPSLQAGLGAQVSMLVVDAGERRHGIGRLLLKAASQAARSAGCDTLGLATGADPDAADASCRATGFTPAGAMMVRALRRRSVA